MVPALQDLIAPCDERTRLYYCYRLVPTRHATAHWHKSRALLWPGGHQLTPGDIASSALQLSISACGLS